MLLTRVHPPPPPPPTHTPTGVYMDVPLLYKPFESLSDFFSFVYLYYRSIYTKWSLATLFHLQLTPLQVQIPHLSTILRVYMSVGKCFPKIQIAILSSCNLSFLYCSLLVASPTA